MKKDWLTDEQVEEEIERLRFDPMVQLARKEQRLKYRRRSELYKLRNLQKRGMELTANGITYDNIEEEMFGVDFEELDDVVSYAKKCLAESDKLFSE